MRRTRVLLADDHMIVAQGLGSLLKDEFDLVGTVADGSKLFEAARTLRPDVIVSDIDMPILSGIDALRKLQEERIEAKVIFLTMHSEGYLASEALRAGASGFLLKSSAGEELITAIQEVVQVRIYLTPRITRDVILSLTRTTGTPQIRLTPRQQQVLKLIAEGRRMKEIATALSLSTRTVENHKYEMMHSLGVQGTAELVRYAIQNGLVDDQFPTGESVAMARGPRLRTP